jgi:hypothetical protein
LEIRKDVLTARVDMLESWKLAGSDLLDNIADSSFRNDVGFNKSDSLGMW